MAWQLVKLPEPLEQRSALMQENSVIGAEQRVELADKLDLDEDRIDLVAGPSAHLLAGCKLGS